MICVPTLHDSLMSSAARKKFQYQFFPTNPYLASAAKHPDLSTYKDVNKDTKLPKVTLTTVDSYLDGFDTQVQQNAKDMYNKFLRYVRHVGNQDGQFIHACDCSNILWHSFCVNLKNY